MKKLIVLVVVVLAIWLGINYMRTGHLSLFPPQMTAEEQRLHELEQELASVTAQISQAGRAAGMTGMDTTADVGALMARKQKIEKEIAEVKNHVLR